MNTAPEEFNWKRFVAVLGASCLLAGIGFGVIIHYATKPNAPDSFAQTNKTPEKDLKIKGNRNSKIYHLPGCPNYNDIAERNIVWFKTHEDAQAAGYRMARNC